MAKAAAENTKIDTNGRPATIIRQPQTQSQLIADVHGENAVRSECSGLLVTSGNVHQ